ncbi:hypothetical protein ACWELJ_33640, partial [Nocardia sp. NPDC004582]
ADVPPAQPVSAPRRARRSWIALGVGLGVVTAAVVVAVLFWRSLTGSPAAGNASDASGQADAQRAGCAYARLISTYDFKTSADYDAYARAVSDGGTGGWLEKWKSSSNDLDEVLIATRAKSEPVDVQCRVESSSADHVRIAALVTNRTSSSADPAGTTKPSNLVLSMTKVGNRWLCEDVTTSSSDASPTPPR